MNGNVLTNSERKGYATRSRVGGQFAMVGPVRLKQSRVRPLDPNKLNRDAAVSVAQCRRGTAIADAHQWFGPCYLPYAFRLRDRPPDTPGEQRAAAAANNGIMNPSPVLNQQNPLQVRNFSLFWTMLFHVLNDLFDTHFLFLISSTLR